MEGAYKEFVRTLLSGNLAVLSREELIAAGRAVSSFLDFVAAQRDPKTAMTLLDNVRNTLYPSLLREYEQASKFSSRSADLLELIRALDLGAIRVLVSILRTLAEESQTLESMIPDWVSSVENVLYRHQGIAGLGMRGAESVLELLVDGQMERAWVLFAELLDAGANPPAGIYRRLLSGWVGPNAPRDMDAG